MSTNNPNLKLMEWVSTPRFSYMLFWHYGEPLIPDNAEVDVRVNPHDPKYLGKTFIGTFITPKELLGRFEEFEKIQFYANGTYIPLSNELLVREISEHNIIRTIDDLLTDDSFKEFFVEESE